jgi:hypothetical protein
MQLQSDLAADQWFIALHQFRRGMLIARANALNEISKFAVFGHGVSPTPCRPIIFQTVLVILMPFQATSYITSSNAVELLFRKYCFFLFVPARQ